MSDYTVTVRGAIPPDLAQRIAVAHAAALKYAERKPTSAWTAPVGEGRTPDAAGQPH